MWQVERKFYCFKNKSGKNSNIDLCGYPGWEKCYLKYLHKRSTPVVVGPNQSLAGSSEISVRNCRNDPNLATSEESKEKNTFLTFWILRAVGNKKNQGRKKGTEEGEYEHDFLEPLLGEQKKSSISKNDLFLFTEVLFFLMEKYHLHDRSSSFLFSPYYSFDLRCLWHRKQRASRSGKSEKDLGFVCYCRLPGPESGSSHGLWS